MKGFGIVLSILGVVGLLIALNIDPGVDSPFGGRVINFHKASERQNYIIITSVVFLGGLVLFGFGAVAGARAAPQTLNLAKDWGRDETEPLANAAMSHAVVNGHVEVAERLLDQGVGANGHHEGINWLHMACLNGHATIVKLLIARGANVNLKDTYGSTPMEHADNGGHDDIVALLREHGARE